MRNPPLLLLLLWAACAPTFVRAQYEDWGQGISAGISVAGVEKGDPPEAPGWRCRVCEDVAQTWRDTFQCAGGGDVSVSPAVTERGESCVPTSNCDQFEGSRKSTCEDIKSSLRTSDADMGLITTRVNEKVGSYDICEQMGKCQPQTSPSGAGCFKAMNSLKCADDVGCEAGETDCDDMCFVCYWVVRSWPVWVGECKRSVGGSAPPPESPPKADALLRRRRRRLLVQAQGKPPTGLGSPPNDPEPENARSTAELGETCFKTWDEFEQSPRARFLTGFTDQLGALAWNANTVCKCLAYCPYDEFEAIQLLSACDWVDDSPDIRESLFPDLSKHVHNHGKRVDPGKAAADRQAQTDYFASARL